MLTQNHRMGGGRAWLSALILGSRLFPQYHGAWATYSNFNIMFSIWRFHLPSNISIADCHLLMRHDTDQNNADRETGPGPPPPQRPVGSDCS